MTVAVAVAVALWADGLITTVACAIGAIAPSEDSIVSRGSQV